MRTGESNNSTSDGGKGHMELSQIIVVSLISWISMSHTGCEVMGTLQHRLNLDLFLLIAFVTVYIAGLLLSVSKILCSSEVGMMRS